jgi:uncharacterized protein YbgA (DUF1722 family)/uncharacterized protein YbbK (DUF523 family)
MVTLPPRPPGPLHIGISQCLVGDEVRYDGSGARSSMPHDKLEGLFTYRSVCPEMGIGMTVPRPPIRLVRVGGSGEVRAVGVRDPAMDKTQSLAAFGAAQAAGFQDLAGYVFMHNSPSCGLFRVKVYERSDAPPRREGRGIYAAAVTAAIPEMPVEEAGRLFDDVLRENFVTRTFAYAHWQTIAEQLTPAFLIAFHSAYKYLLMAHSQTVYHETGRLLSNLKGDLDAISNRYISLLMQGLSVPATRNGHANVMAHLQGYLKRKLDSPSRQELERLIQAYRRGEQPLLAPLTLLKHHFRRYPDEYVLNQSYLEPHPTQAGLRRQL